jgi:hypothetical protein
VDGEVKVVEGTWKYVVYINGEMVDETHEPLSAYMKLESAELLEMGVCELQQVYDGPSEHYDPVIHGTRILERGGNFPPCPSNHAQCPYRKSRQNDFYSTPHPTAYRVEVMPPVDRCGYLLKPKRIGGDFSDYAPCQKYTPIVDGGPP